MTGKVVLEGMRNDVEDFVLTRLREVVPETVRTMVLADRGFGDQKLYALMEQLKFEYIVRFRQCIQVMDGNGEKRSAGEWMPQPNLLKTSPSDLGSSLGSPSRSNLKREFRAYKAPAGCH